MVASVNDWLNTLDMSQYADAFARNAIVADMLSDLSHADLKELGVEPLGHRLAIIRAAKELDTQSIVHSDAGPDRRKDKRVGAGNAIHGERRNLTVMFCDLVGSTGLSSRLDPEDLSEVIRSYQRCAEAVIERFGGRIAQYLGDGLLVYFGYPIAHEDDAMRAVYAGIGLPKAIATMSQQLSVRYGEKLTVRIGIHTGPVVVGEMGGDNHSEQLAMGETPNVAARLQSLAESGTVVISDTTKRLLAEQFDLTPLGARSLKGIAEPVDAFVVNAERLTETRFAAGHHTGSNEMVGREQELAMLMTHWRQAKTGKGQLVVISGESGIGKSQLTSALANTLSDQDHVRVSFQCSAYHTDTALYPAIQHLSFAAGVSAGMPHQLQLEKLEALLERGQNKTENAAHILGGLMGLRDAANKRYGEFDLSPQQRREQTLDVMRAQLSGIASQRPVLFVIEDIHWIDPTTLALVDRSLELVAALPILMITTSRPGFTHEFQNHPSVSRLMLSRLGRQEVTEIIERIVRGKRLAPAVVDEIVSKTDGVPLFVEELTKTLLESGHLRQNDMGDYFIDHLDQLTVPHSLHDSLMERLDRLGSAKRLAQVAAAIGREFTLALLDAIRPLGARRLDHELKQLINSELIHQKAPPPNARYQFRHALMQEAAYESLPRRAREALHSEIAEIIESQDGDLGNGEVTLLAHHYARSTQPEKAVRYLMHLGDTAVQIHARAEATTAYAETLTIAQSLPDSRDVLRWRIDAAIKIASISSDTRAETQRDETQLLQAEALAHELHDQRRLASILYWLGRVHYARGERVAAADFAERSLAIADSLEDETLAAPPLNLLGRYYATQGNVRRGAKLLLRSADQMNRLGYIGEQATAAGVAGCALAAKGDFDDGLAQAELSLSLAKQQRDPFATCAAYFYRSLIFAHRGDWQQANDAANQGASIAESAGDRFRGYLIEIVKGETILALGDAEQARNVLNKAITFAAQAGTCMYLGLAKRHLAAACWELGETENALAVCNDAMSIANAIDEGFSSGLATRLYVDFLCRLDRSNDPLARQLILKAIGTHRANGAQPELARCYLLYARMQNDCGQHERAKHRAHIATQMFKRMKMNWDLSGSLLN